MKSYHVYCSRKNLVSEKFLLINIYICATISMKMAGCMYYLEDILKCKFNVTQKKYN